MPGAYHLTLTRSSGDLFSQGDRGRDWAQTLTLWVLESSLDLPCAVRTKDEGRPPAHYEKIVHVPQPGTERPGLPWTRNAATTTWAHLPAPPGDDALGSSDPAPGP